MTNEQKSLDEYEALLAAKERNLLLQREEVWNFLDTEHTSGDNKKYQSLVRKADKEITTVLRALLGNENTPQEFHVAAKDLCQRCRDLHSYTRDMSKALADDLAERRHAEDKKTIDVIKNMSFFFAVPAALITAVKNGVGDGYVNVTEAAVAGAGISVSILNRKRLTKAFRALGNAVCITPQDVRESPVIFYLKESAKEKVRMASRAIRSITGNKIEAKL